jgi:hypothetical protein
MAMNNSRKLIAIFAISVIALVGGTQVEAASASAPHYKNCTAMHKHYPHGVGRSGAHDKSSKPVTNFKVSTTIYNANKHLDRDKDGVACEAH